MPVFIRKKGPGEASPPELAPQHVAACMPVLLAVDVLCWSCPAATHPLLCLLCDLMFFGMPPLPPPPPPHPLHLQATCIKQCVDAELGDGRVAHVALGSSCADTSFECKDPAAISNTTLRSSNCSGLSLVFNTVAQFSVQLPGDDSLNSYAVLTGAQGDLAPASATSKGDWVECRGKRGGGATQHGSTTPADVSHIPLGPRRVLHW
jgi:hypothetical protein